VSEADRPPDVDKLVAELRRTVEERYRSGEYPSELGLDLARHFDQVSSQASPRPGGLAHLQARVDKAADFSSSRIPDMSSILLGSSVHRLIGKVTRRQSEGVLQQMREYADALRLLLLALIEAAEAGGADKRARLDGIDDLAARRARLLGQVQAAGAESFATISDRLAGSAPVVDLDSGSGQVLEALRDREIEAIGVDPDPDLVAMLTAKGLNAVMSDSVAYLESLEDGSVGGIIARHRAGDGRSLRLLEVVAQAQRTLRPAGRLIVDVVNRLPASGPNIKAAAIPADLLGALVERAGFTDSEVVPRHDPDTDGRLERIPDSAGLDPDLQALLNRNWEMLDRLAGGFRDFALIATR
jgi:SAM-dependent methyltransferase